MSRPSRSTSNKRKVWHWFIIFASSSICRSDSFSSHSSSTSSNYFPWSSNLRRLLPLSSSTNDYESLSSSNLRNLANSHNKKYYHHSTNTTNSTHANTANTTNSTSSTTSSVEEEILKQDEEQLNNTKNEGNNDTMYDVVDPSPNSTVSLTTASTSENTTTNELSSDTEEELGTNMTESSSNTTSTSSTELVSNLTASIAPTPSATAFVVPELSNNVTITGNETQNLTSSLAPSMASTFVPKPSDNVTILGNETTSFVNETGINDSDEHEEFSTYSPTPSPTNTPTEDVVYEEESKPTDTFVSNENMYGSNVENGNIKNKTISNSPVLLGLMLAFFLILSLCTIYVVKMNPDGLCATIVRCFGLITWSIITCPFKLCGICSRRGRDGFDEAGEYYSNQDRFVARDLELH